MSGGGIAAVQVRAPRAAHAPPAAEAKPTPTPADRARNRAGAAAERKQRAAAAKRVADLEKRVAAGEARLREIEARLADPDLYRFPMEADILGREHTKLTAEVADLYAAWEAELESASLGEAGLPAGAGGSAG